MTNYERDSKLNSLVQSWRIGLIDEATLLSLVQALGVNDADLLDAIGDAILRANPNTKETSMASNYAPEPCAECGTPIMAQETVMGMTYTHINIPLNSKHTARPVVILATAALDAMWEVVLDATRISRFSGSCDFVNNMVDRYTILDGVCREVIGAPFNSAGVANRERRCGCYSCNLREQVNE